MERMVDGFTTNDHIKGKSLFLHWVNTLADSEQNGLILEALTMFKKNVSLHFEGVVECAICYS